MSEIEMGSIMSKPQRWPPFASREQRDYNGGSDPKKEKKQGEEKPTKKNGDGDDDDDVLESGKVVFVGAEGVAAYTEIRTEPDTKKDDDGDDDEVVFVGAEGVAAHETSDGGSPRFHGFGSSEIAAESEYVGSLTEFRRELAAFDLDIAHGACYQMAKNVKHSKEMKAHIYKHILEDVSALLDPDTLEVLGEADPRLKEFLSHTSMEELIDLEIFRFDMEVDIIIETEFVDGPVPEQVETEVVDGPVPEHAEFFVASM